MNLPRAPTATIVWVFGVTTLCKFSPWGQGFCQNQPELNDVGVCAIAGAAKVKTPIIPPSANTALAEKLNTLNLRMILNMIRPPYSAGFVKRTIGSPLEITWRSVRCEPEGIWRLKLEQKCKINSW